MNKTFNFIGQIKEDILKTGNFAEDFVS